MDFRSLDRFLHLYLMICLVFFAFTTILGWDYYSERCLEYLTNGHKKNNPYIPLALHSGSIYRTVHDSKCCMDNRRYLQRTDGDSEYDRIVRIKWSDRKKKKQKAILCNRKKA